MDLPGYNIEQNPTESSAGGTFIYIYIYIYLYLKTYGINAEQTYRYATQKNWNLYSLKS